MTHRRSVITENYQLHSADLARTACACSLPASHEAAKLPENIASSAFSTACASASGTMHNFSHNTDATVAPTDCTLSHRRIQDPRGFHLGRFSNAGRGRPNAQRSTATRNRKPSPKLPFDVLSRAAALKNVRDRGEHQLRLSVIRREPRQSKRDSVVG